MAVAQPWLNYCDLSKSYDHVVIMLQITDKKWSMDYFPRGVPPAQFHNRGPFVTDDIKICQSYMTALSSGTSTYVLVQWCPVQKL